MELTTKTPNAEKWTEEKMKQLLDSLEVHLNLNEDNLYIGTMLSYFGLYPDLWAYLKRSYAGHETFSKRIREIEYIFEARIVEAALYKRISPSMAMFVLRCKYGWKDKTLEPAQPKEAEKPAEQSADPAPAAPADAGSATIEDEDYERTMVTRVLPRIRPIDVDEELHKAKGYTLPLEKQRAAR